MKCLSSVTPKVSPGDAQQASLNQVDVFAREGSFACAATSISLTSQLVLTFYSAQKGRMSSSQPRSC